MNLTDLEHGDVVSIERIGSATVSNEATATANKPAVVLATVRDINKTAGSVSLRAG